MDDRQRHGQLNESKGNQSPNTTATQPNKEIFQSVVRMSPAQTTTTTPRILSIKKVLCI